MILYHTLKFYPTFETRIFSQLRTKHMFIYHNNYCSNGQSQVVSIEPDV
jgi:hypothetical protein